MLEGKTVQIRLINPEYYDAEGGLHVDAKDLEWVSMTLGNPSTCGHTDELCAQCLPRWVMSDWEVNGATLPGELNSLRDQLGLPLVIREYRRLTLADVVRRKQQL